MISHRAVFKEHEAFCRAWIGIAGVPVTVPFRRVPVTGASRNCVECDRLFKEYEERLLGMLEEQECDL